MKTENYKMGKFENHDCSGKSQHFPLQNPSIFKETQWINIPIVGIAVVGEVVVGSEVGEVGDGVSENPQQSHDTLRYFTVKNCRKLKNVMIMSPTCKDYQVNVPSVVGTAVVGAVVVGSIVGSVVGAEVSSWQ